MFINLCCQLINQISCIWEQGLEEIGEKISRELLGVVGIEGRKVRKYFNHRRPGAKSVDCVWGYLTYKRRNLIFFPLLVDERLGTITWSIIADLMEDLGFSSAWVRSHHGVSRGQWLSFLNASFGCSAAPTGFRKVGCGVWEKAGQGHMESDNWRDGMDGGPRYWDEERFLELLGRRLEIRGFIRHRSSLTCLWNVSMWRYWEHS